MVLNMKLITLVKLGMVMVMVNVKVLMVNMVTILWRS